MYNFLLPSSCMMKNDKEIAQTIIPFKIGNTSLYPVELRVILHNSKVHQILYEIRFFEY
jgi:hypothetical protein